MATDMENTRPLSEADMKPCPFCGEAPRLARFFGGPTGYAVMCVNAACPVRAATSCSPLKEEAIGWWNTRKEVSHV